MLLNSASKDFIDDRQYKNLSKYTVSGYRRTLDAFHQFCVENSVVDTSNTTYALVKKYFMYCQDKRNNTAVTLNHKLINLRAFFNYAEKELETYTEKNNPVRKISRFKTDVTVDVFTDNQIRQIMLYFRRMKTRDKTFYAFRDTAIVITLLGTGIRLGELINLRWKDVDFDNNTITVFGKKRMMSTLPMTSKLRMELAEYKLFVEQNLNQEPEYVFVTIAGKQMTDNAVKNMFKRAQKVMNFKDVRLSSHTFHHTVA